MAEPGTYKFTVTSDDGVRLYIDGQKVLDKWILQGPTTYTVSRHLTAGDARDRAGVLRGILGCGREVRLREDLRPASAAAAPEPFAAEYFDNSTLSGTPVVTRTDEAIDFDWGADAPSLVLPVNFFSARWTRTKSYAAGTYRFSVTGDDGIRVLVDGTQVIDGWVPQWPTTYTADVQLSDGQHTVVVEYFEHTGGAVAKFNESRLADPP